MDSIEKLKNLFSQFPTVGQRTAGRFVYYLLKLPKEKIKELTDAIEELRLKVKLCQFCFNPFESEGGLCNICRDTSRNQSILCIIEKEADLISLENSKKYKGRYFILGNSILVPKNEDNPRIQNLKEIIKLNNFSEIIVALNPTSEGKNTSVMVENVIKECGKILKITHLAQGIPVGGELEYADPETLESALEGRK